MNAPKPITIEVEPARNLVHIGFYGDIGVMEINEYEKDVALMLTTVSRDFLLLTDLTGLNSMDVLCAPAIRRTMDQFAGHGVKRVVRIIPNRRKDIGFSIMSLFHYSRKVQIITCTTREEADRALE